MEEGGRPRLKALAASIVAAALVVLVPPSTASQRAPDGYRTFGERTLVRDVVTYGVARAGTHNLRVARMGPEAGVRLTAGLAFERVTTKETTSSICRRANCLLAVNGDYFDIHSAQPIGGMIVDGTLVRSPVWWHPQLVITEDGRWSAELLGWSSQLDPEPVPAEEAPELLPTLPGEEEDKDDEPAHDPDEPVGVVGVNTQPAHDAVVAYTTRWHDTTLTGPEWAELTVRIAEPMRPDQAQPVELVHFSRDGGNAPIPPDGVVFSGHGEGAAALERLWRDARNGTVHEIRLVSDASVDGIVTSIGGGPVVLRDGRYVAGDGSIARSRHPRTLVAWNEHGERWFVTVDGRQPGYSRGMTLREAADFLRSLGATEAINFDGGGSTTFVQQGNVTNRPIHAGRAGRERPVANAIVALATEPLIAPPTPEPVPAPAETPPPPPTPPPAETPPPPSATPEPEPVATPEPSPTPEPELLAAPPGTSYSAPEDVTQDRRPLAAGAIGLLLTAGVAVTTRFRRP